MLRTRVERSPVVVVAASLCESSTAVSIMSLVKYIHLQIEIKLPGSTHMAIRFHWPNLAYAETTNHAYVRRVSSFAMEESV